MAWHDDPDRQRPMLALSFEPTDDGYVYYHWRWSRGIPVTIEEREAYLRIPALGSRRAWRRAIAERATVAPRPFGPTHRKLLARMPVSAMVAGFSIGAILALTALAEPSSVSRIFCMIAGLAMIAFAGQIAIAKWAIRKGAPTS